MKKYILHGFEKPIHTNSIAKIKVLTKCRNISFEHKFKDKFSIEIVDHPYKLYYESSEYGFYFNGFEEMQLYIWSNFRVHYSLDDLKARVVEIN